MPRSLIALAAALLGLTTAAPAWAEHAKIDLEVKTLSGHQTAHVDQTPPEWGKNPRPVLKAKAGEMIRVEWLFTNVYPHKTLENVIVHFFITREQKVGQKELPNLADEDAVVLETAFDMDFKPGGKAGAKSTLKIDKPGVYLVRVESRNTHSDHEHFAAIDLVIAEDTP
jgi:hypothetical protein